MAERGKRRDERGNEESGGKKDEPGDLWSERVREGDAGGEKRIRREEFKEKL